MSRKDATTNTNNNSVMISNFHFNLLSLSLKEKRPIEPDDLDCNSTKIKKYRSVL